MQKINLSTAQEFEIEYFSRVIDQATDLNQLRTVAKGILKAWELQKSATKWAIAQRNLQLDKATKKMLNDLDKLPGIP
jgi:hypothetical protein